MSKKTSEGFCEMCGNNVEIRQKAHIFAENKKIAGNVLMLCPTCHVRFDTHIKPKVFAAIKNSGLKYLPPSWAKSIYQQAAEASQAARKKIKKIAAENTIRARRCAAKTAAGIRCKRMVKDSRAKCCKAHKGSKKSW